MKFSAKLAGICAAAMMMAGSPAQAAKAVTMDLLGRYSTGLFDEGASEIPAYDPETRRAFVVNAANANVDVLDLTDPTHPVKLGTIDIHEYGSSVNSVAISRGVVALAIQADVKTDNGKVALYSSSVDLSAPTPLSVVSVGALPDMLSFTPNGRKLLVCNEGEPNDDYTVDPLGSVSIIDVSNPKSPVPHMASFTGFNDQLDELRAAGVRIFGPNATVAQDLEPEYLATSADGQTAYVTLQENNALAIIDISRAVVRDIVPLGYKDDLAEGNALDASDKDSAIHIAQWPVLGMYQPDSIAAYEVGRKTYLVTANEGDARDYDGFAEESRIKSLSLDPVAFPDAVNLQKDAQIGRLNVTTTLGDIDDDGDYDALYTFGGRSFSIWSSSGELVWDSGSLVEQLVAEYEPGNFNADNTANDFDNRSDNKGPEPEGLALGQFGKRTIAFVGLERQSAILVFDITTPRAPKFLNYVSTRNFAADPEDNLAEAGDLGPEGLKFVPAEESPNGEPMLIVGNEISGTTAFFRVDATIVPPAR
jgi:DNA-binding beta-propeller fold protein YncE